MEDLRIALFIFCSQWKASFTVSTRTLRNSTVRLSSIFRLVQRPSVPSIDSSSGVRLVWCWAPCGRRVPAVSRYLLQARAQQQMRAASCSDPRNEAQRRLVSVVVQGWWGVVGVSRAHAGARCRPRGSAHQTRRGRRVGASRTACSASARSSGTKYWYRTRSTRYEYRTAGTTSDLRKTLFARLKSRSRSVFSRPRPKPILPGPIPQISRPTPKGKTMIRHCHHVTHLTREYWHHDCHSKKNFTASKQQSLLRLYRANSEVY